VASTAPGFNQKSPPLLLKSQALWTYKGKRHEPNIRKTKQMEKDCDGPRFCDPCDRAQTSPIPFTLHVSRFTPHVSSNKVCGPIKVKDMKPSHHWRRGLNPNQKSKIQNENRITQ